MVCRIEALVQELQLCAEVFDVSVKVLERFVSEGEIRVVCDLTSSEKPVMLLYVAEGRKRRLGAQSVLDIIS